MGEGTVQCVARWLRLSRTLSHGGIRAIEARIQGPDLFHKVPLEIGRAALFAGRSNGHTPPHPLSAHVASAWIGNSVAVAVEHYLQVTEDHFKQTIEKETQTPTSKAHETSRNDSKTQTPSQALESESSSSCEMLRPIAISCSPSEIQSMGDTGLKLCPNDPRNTRISKEETHNPTHRAHMFTTISSDLQRVIDAWASLPATTRPGIMAMVQEVIRE